jgi:hypothetical protein
MKGGIIDYETGMKAVWLRFMNQTCRTAIRAAILAHNAVAEESLKIRLSKDDGIICCEKRVRLTQHPVYARIIDAKSRAGGGYWEQ